MSIEARPELGLRVVEVDHDQSLEPDALVEVGQEGVDRGGIRDVDAGRPGVRDVEAEAEPLGRDATRGRRLEDAGELRDVRPEREPAARRVLEDDTRGSWAVVDLTEDAREAVRQAFGPGRDAGSAMRPDVDVDEPPEVSGRRRSSLARSCTDRASESSSSPARLTRYEAWMAIGPMSSSTSRARNAA